MKNFRKLPNFLWSGLRVTVIVYNFIWWTQTDKHEIDLKKNKQPFTIIGNLWYPAMLNSNQREVEPQTQQL